MVDGRVPGLAILTVVMAFMRAVCGLVMPVAGAVAFDSRPELPSGCGVARWS